MIDYSYWIAWTVLSLGFFVAALGTVIPGLPGAVFVLAAAVVHKILLPSVFSNSTLVWLAVLTAASFGVDFFGTFLGAKLGRSSRYGLIGAAIGGMFGIAFGIPGLIFGPFIGAILGDLLANRKEVFELLRSGTGAGFGFIFSLFMRIGILFGMALVVVFTVLTK